MKVLYLDLGMGVAGDMLTAALLELCPDADKIVEKLNSLNIPGVHFKRESVKKSGICGTYMHVMIHGVEEECGHVHSEHEHTHHHTCLSDIKEVVAGLNTSDKIKNQVLDVYNIIADAESKVHGEKVEQIHFHEVGNMDAVADVAAVCTIVDEIGADKIVASPVHVGSGYVMCAHGKLPVPAPATAYILKGIPSYSDGIKGELCTPTGAALIKYFVDEFTDMPVMSVSEIGYGFGKKEFERLNCVRAFVGEGVEKEIKDISYKKGKNNYVENDINKCYDSERKSLMRDMFCEKNMEITDEIIELVCNIDDMTAEEIGFATEKLFDAGALDIYTVSAYMKKNRPGTIISCLCYKEQKDKFVRLMFKYTTTIGVRQYECDRYVLSRKMENRKTVYGNVRVKKSFGYGVQKQKTEYEDLSNIAKRRQKSLFEIKDDINC